MSDKSSNNKRIAKNTVMLYFRMIVTTLVSLYTARLTLQLLGASDYGINNVVAGIVGFTGIITGTMIQATQRFLSVDLGKGDIKQFQKTFSMVMNIFMIVCLISILLLELVGPFYIQTKLVIPKDRLVAAHWIYQFSIFDFVLTTLAITYNAAIVAHERMTLYAYFTFIDVFFKLLVVFGLYVTPIDKLITLGALGVVACVVRNVIIYMYCKKQVPGCVYTRYWDNSLFKSLFSYMGWSFLGSTSRVMTIQGQAIILNLFFGPIINAAKAIADKINGIIFSFVSNFFMAVTPQIIKSYSEGNYSYTKSLVVYASKLGYYLLLVISIPLICNMAPILTLWLGHEQVSTEMIQFCQLILVYSLVVSLEGPLTKVVQATGNVKKYEVIVGVITLSFLPFCYLIFKVGMPAYSSLILLSVVYFIAHAYRVLHVSHLIDLPVGEYFFKILVPIIVVSGISFLLSSLILKEADGLWIIFLNLIFSFIITCLSVAVLGVTPNERRKMVDMIKRRV